MSAATKGGQLPIYIEPYAPPNWWKKDAANESHGACEGHIKYTLTCGQYERLLARARHECEVCHLPAAANAFGRLYIDHVNELGDWAVRGLLCLGCNAALSPGAIRKQQFADYAAQPFYQVLLDEAGVTDLSPVEPRLGAVVLDHGGRPWRHEPGGWWPRHRRYPQSPRTWKWLLFKVGPHNLKMHMHQATEGA